MHPNLLWHGFDLDHAYESNPFNASRQSPKKGAEGTAAGRLSSTSIILREK
jgi:hypothetical protein